MRKAQMFVVTMVFLVSLIFVVQQNLLQYTAVDTIDIFETHDLYLINNMKEMFQDTLDYSQTCDTGIDNASYNLNLLTAYMKDQIYIGGYTVDFGETLNNLDCSNWGSNDPVNPLLVLEIKLVRGIETETEGVYYLVRN